MSTWPARLLMGALAILLPAGAWAAVAVDRDPPAPDRQVIAAGFLQDGIAGAEAQPRSPQPAQVTTTAPAPAAAPSTPATSPNRSGAPAAVSTSTTTTATTLRPGKATTTTSPTFTIPPGLPLGPPTSTILGGSSWSQQGDGVSVHMRMVPAKPVAGEPVTFSVDLTAQDPCCAVALMFGDAPTSFQNFGGGNCDGPTSLSGLSVTHTYAAPGAYEALATATFPCHPTTSVPGGPPVPPAIHGVGIHACIVIGPGDAGAGGCSSAPPPIYSVPPATG